MDSKDGSFLSSKDNDRDTPQVSCSDGPFEMTGCHYRLCNNANTQA